MSDHGHGNPYRIYWVTWGILLVITVAMLAAEKLPHAALVPGAVPARLHDGQGGHDRRQLHAPALREDEPGVHGGRAGSCVTSLILFLYIAPESRTCWPRRCDEPPAPRAAARPRRSRSLACRRRRRAAQCSMCKATLDAARPRAAGSRQPSSTARSSSCSRRPTCVFGLLRLPRSSAAASALPPAAVGRPPSRRPGRRRALGAHDAPRPARPQRRAERHSARSCCSSATCCIRARPARGPPRAHAGRRRELGAVPGSATSSTTSRSAPCASRDRASCAPSTSRSCSATRAGRRHRAPRAR